MTVPSPDLFSDWKTWARRLVGSLSQQRSVAPLPLAHYSVSSLPDANRDGMLIWVVDETGGPTVAFSADGDWRRVQDRSVVA